MWEYTWQVPPFTGRNLPDFCTQKKKKRLNGICINSDVCTNFIKQFPKCLKTKQNWITETTKTSDLQRVI